RPGGSVRPRAPLRRWYSDRPPLVDLSVHRGLGGPHIIAGPQPGAPRSADAVRVPLRRPPVRHLHRRATTPLPPARAGEGRGGGLGHCGARDRVADSPVALPGGAGHGTGVLCYWGGRTYSRRERCIDRPLFATVAGGGGGGGVSGG